MKKLLLFIIAALLFATSANAQWGLIDLGAAAVNKAKEKKAEKRQAALSDLHLPTTPDKKAKPITFKWGNTTIGTYNPTTFEIAFNLKYEDGSMKGQQIVYKIDPATGDVKSNNGTPKGYMRDGGEIESPNLGKLQAKREGGKTIVYRNGKEIGQVNTAKAWCEGNDNIGSFDQDVSNLLVAYLYFGCLVAESQLIEWKAEPIIPQPSKELKEVTFKVEGDVFGTWNPETLQLTTTLTYKEGANAGKKIIMVLDPQTGKIANNAGAVLGSINNNGTIISIDGDKYTLKDGKVYDGNAIVGIIGKDHTVTSYDVQVGEMDGYVSPLLAAYVYFGVLISKENIATYKAEQEARIKAEAERRAQEEAARKKAEEERLKAELANLIPVQKGSSTVGYVAKSGNVYNRDKKIIGQLPSGGCGTIKDSGGWRIGDISCDTEITNSSGKKWRVHGGTIYVLSNGTYGEWETIGSVDSYGRVNLGSSQVGECNCGYDKWAVALIICGFFF